MYKKTLGFKLYKIKQHFSLLVTDIMFNYCFFRKLFSLNSYFYYYQNKKLHILHVLE